MKEKVKCLSCGCEVEVELTSYGEGEVGICPKCGGIAYNSKKEKAAF
jgi:hypothetical protein